MIFTFILIKILKFVLAIFITLNISNTIISFMIIYPELQNNTSHSNKLKLLQSREVHPNQGSLINFNRISKKTKITKILFSSVQFFF